MAAREIHTEILIDAEADAVWQVLTDFPRYAEWNPFVRAIEGRLAVGQRLKVTLGLGDRPLTIRPRVVCYAAGRVFCWRGHLFVPGLFDGTHKFTVEPTDDGKARFIHGEVFHGLLVGPILARVGEQTEGGFRSMNEALKVRCEAQA